MLTKKNLTTSTPCTYCTHHLLDSYTLFLTCIVYFKSPLILLLFARNGDTYVDLVCPSNVYKIGILLSTCSHLPIIYMIWDHELIVIYRLNCKLHVFQKHSYFTSTRPFQPPNHFNHFIHLSLA
jgi:hypothetical protein